MSMRGASAEAVARLGDQLREQVSGAPRRAATMAGELFSVSTTLRHEGALRRFLTDASVPAEGKTGLVRQVFAGQADEHTVELLDAAVSARWTSAGDLPEALEDLSVVAAVRSAGTDSERLSDELFTVDQAVRHDSSLRDALSDPARSTGDKEQLVRDLLGDAALEATVLLTVQAVTGSHRTVTAALGVYQKVAGQVHGERVATVRVAKPLTDEDTRRLEQALATQYDRPVHLNLVVDPDVIGGVRVEIGDDVIDGTVASRLADARRRLAGTAG